MTKVAVQTIRRSDWRRTYIMQHPLALTISLAMLLTGLLLLFSPPLFANTVVARALPNGLEYPWDVTLVVGGGLTVAGFALLDARYEIAGLILQATAMFIWAFLYVATTPPGSPVLAVFPTALTTATALGFGFRAFILATQPEDAPWTQRSST